MSIKTFIAEFQDYLFNFEPIFDRIDTKRASKTDYFGAFKQAEEILEEYKESLDFLEREALTVTNEIETILNSLDKKLDKIETFASTIIGINSSQDTYKELLTINPYLLTELPDWETTQKCVLLPIISTFREIKPYSSVVKDGKAVAKFTIGDQYSTKYLAIKKSVTTQLISISYLNDNKEVLETVSLPSTLNKSDITVEIPLTTRYVSLDYYYDTDHLVTITPLSFKHSPFSDTSLPTKEYEYGSLLVFNSNIELPLGCYASLDLHLSFKDVNGTEVVSIQAVLPLNSDGYAVKQAKYLSDEKVKGYWLNSVYSEENLENIPPDAYVLYRPKYDTSAQIFTEAALKLNVKNAKTVKVEATLKFYSLYKQTHTPRLFYLTGMTKNV